MKKHLITSMILAALLVGGKAIAQRGHIRDAVHDKEYNEHGASGEDKLNGWLGNLTNVRVARKYNFPMHMRVHMVTYGRRGKIKDEMEMDAYVNAARSTTAVRLYEEKRSGRQPATFSIYDYKNNNSIIFDLKKNTYMAFNLNAFVSKENQTRRETGKARVNEHIDCKKTGRKKMILGYSCSEYVCTDERLGERKEYWIAAQLPYTLSDALARTYRQRYMGNTQGMSGAVLEEHDYKGEDLIREMTVTELTPKENFSFSTQEYAYNGIGEVHFYD
jgi:hypothetical protein